MLYFRSAKTRESEESTRHKSRPVMEMLNRVGLARLVNPCFKITALEISGCLVVRSSETTKKFTGQPIFW